MLALSALESRRALDEPAPVALAALATAVCAQFQPAAEARDLQLERTCNADPVVRGESFLLEIALTNLLQNAIDFSAPGGRIRVTVSAVGEHAELTVEDEGTGIPDYASSRIFERFYSLQHPATGRKSSGLGLCFVREAAELHGGIAEVK